jgi:uncharacterized protein YdeI (YjbR/CyaY-like superfamily)
MATNTTKSFCAVLEPLRSNLGWVIAHVPFDIHKAWPKLVRLRVVVETGGHIFRTSLFPEPTTGGFFILVNKKMQQAAGVKVGGMIDLTVSADLAEREAELPPEFEKILKREKALAKWFATLSDSTRLEIGKWLVGVKGPEARQRRIDQMAERLLLTMEGEKSLPPILEVAFNRNPAARKGWQAMTPTQRRSHLMGIFYYQTPEARDKRTAKAIEEALKLVHR